LSPGFLFIENKLLILYKNCDKYKNFKKRKEKKNKYVRIIKIAKK